MVPKRCSRVQPISPSTWAEPRSDYSEWEGQSTPCARYNQPPSQGIDLDRTQLASRCRRSPVWPCNDWNIFGKAQDMVTWNGVPWGGGCDIKTMAQSGLERLLSSKHVMLLFIYIYYIYIYILYIFYLRFKRYAFIWFYLMPEVRGSLRWQVWWQVRWRWQLDMAMWVAVLVAMKRWWQVWWQKWWQPYFGGNRGGNFAWQKLSWKFSNHILAAAEVSKFDGSFLCRKGCKHLQSQKGVECTWHMLTERVWETFWRQMGW